MEFTVRLLVFFSLFLQPISVFSQTNGKVAVGSSLTARAGNSNLLSSWHSPSGDFVFGFLPLENNDMFLLSIWYAKIPDKTIVWYAHGDNKPAVAAAGSTVNLTANSGLVLTSPQGEELWKSQTSVGVFSYGVMNDTGNFVLQDVSSQTLWETFRNPTDTMLPGQAIEKNGKLSSRLSERNYAKGRFELLLQGDGNLVLNTVNLPTDFVRGPYYHTGTSGNPKHNGDQLVLTGSGCMYLLLEDGFNFSFFSNFSLPGAEELSASDNYIRATLNFDGIFAQYFHPKTFTGNVSWIPLWSLPDDICKEIPDLSDVGACGYNSICTLKPNKRPTCECPRGFSLLDPNDTNGGCKPDFIPSCGEDELTPERDLYDIEVLTNVNWPTSNYATLEPFTAEKCNESCFQDCLCAVAIHIDGTCKKKKLPLEHGRIDVNSNARAFIKVGKNNSIRQAPHSAIADDKRKKKNWTTLILVGLALLGSSVFINFILGTGFFFISRRKYVRCTKDVLYSTLSSFSYQELEEATNGFTEELGRGAFGVVYKGRLQIGSGVQVAVKKLNCVVQDGEKEFKTELSVIGKTHHKNLVCLVGYCDEGQHRLLVYEFLSNGTIAKFLFADVKPSWRQRVEIASGIAKGLEYLHEDCSTQIIHCDIKSENILLDDYYNARISDFGLAKLLMMNQSETITAIRGTKGYVAPEWFRNRPITPKVDVYSFGVVLLEVICCRRSVDMGNSCEEKAILTDWVYDCYRDGMLEAVVDSEVEALNDRTKLETFVMVALWCIQEDPSLRPTMRKVMQMLEGVVEVHVPPCPFRFARTD